MASTAKSTSIMDRSGRRAREEPGVVEIAATFGRMLGLADSQKVGTFGHDTEYLLKQRLRWLFCYI